MKTLKRKNMNPVELSFRETMWKLPIHSIVVACEVLKRIDAVMADKSPKVFNYKGEVGTVQIDFTFVQNKIEEKKEEVKP